jgi:hypothetical protein
MNKEAFANLIAAAEKAGLLAGKTVGVQPMVVQQHASPFDDNSPVEKEWIVEGGPCGFAWVNIKPGTSAFAKYLKETGKARSDSYYGGVTVWVGAFGQSMTRKEAYARAYAGVLQTAGYKAYANSRMD